MEKEQKFPSDEEIISKINELRKAILKSKRTSGKSKIYDFLERIKPHIREAIRNGHSMPSISRIIKDVFDVDISVAILRGFCNTYGIQTPRKNKKKHKT